MVRSGRVMQMKSCIIKYDLSVCRIFSFFCFFVHTARNSTAVVRHVYMLLFEIEISDVRFFSFRMRDFFVSDVILVVVSVVISVFVSVLISVLVLVVRMQDVSGLRLVS